MSKNECQMGADPGEIRASFFSLPFEGWHRQPPSRRLSVSRSDERNHHGLSLTIETVHELVLVTELRSVMRCPKLRFASSLPGAGVDGG
jgi:hypothetical protein